MTDDAPKTAAHTEKETLAVAVNIPEHDPRVTTALFAHTRKLAIAECGGRCWICERTEAETGEPVQLHHFPVERSFGDMVDWDLFKRQALAGDYGPRVQSFDWASFDPTRWFTFVDNMMHNGLPLCPQHHIGADEGIHLLPHPIWLAQRFAKEGYDFSTVEVIHHDQV
jgi:hypothetical protein